MPDVHSIRRREPRIKEFPFFCEFNGFGFPMTLKRLTSIEIMGALENAEGYVTKYVTGKGDPDSDKFEPPTPLPAIDGEAVAITKGACRMLAIIELAQRQEPAYSFTQLVAMTASEDIQEQLMDAADWAQPEERGKGNRSANTATGSTITPSGDSTISPN